MQIWASGEGNFGTKGKLMGATTTPHKEPRAKSEFNTVQTLGAQGFETTFFSRTFHGHFHGHFWKVLQ